MIKILGTNSFIHVLMDGRSIHIKGERIAGGFIADACSIIEWDDGSKVTESEKEQIISQVLEKTKQSWMIISFE